MNNNFLLQTKKREFSTRWTFEEADRVSNYLFSRLLLGLKREFDQNGNPRPLVIGSVVEAERLKVFLPLETGAKVGVIFLPEQLASFSAVIAQQNIEDTGCWALDLFGYAVSYSWKLPGLRLAAPHFDETLRSELWMPIGCLDMITPSIGHPEEIQRMYLFVATHCEVFVISYLVHEQDTINSMCTDSALKRLRRRRHELFTPEELSTAAAQAEIFGAYPWMDGVWPVLPGTREDRYDIYGRPQNFVNVVGAFMQAKMPKLPDEFQKFDKNKSMVTTEPYDQFSLDDLI